MLFRSTPARNRHYSEPAFGAYSELAFEIVKHHSVKDERWQADRLQSPEYQSYLRPHGVAGWRDSSQSNTIGPTIYF